MYIMSNFLNTLRDSTIQEYLNEDKNRSAYLANQIRKSVQKFEGVLQPEVYEQINSMELKNTNDIVNEIKTKLLDTFNSFNTLFNDTDYKSTDYSQLYNEIGNYTTVLIDYNKLVNMYLVTTNNIITRQEIYSTLMETREIYKKLATISLKVLDNYISITDVRLKETTIRKYFVKVLLLYSLYDVISKQFENNQFFIIPEGSILYNIETMPDRIRGIIRQYRLKVELYGIPTPPTAAGQLPPQGGTPADRRDYRPGGGRGGLPPPPKPPRVFKKDDPDYMKNYMRNYIREKDYYRTHYATIITCPSCEKQLTRQKLSRHLKTTFKCRFVRMDNELQDLKQKLSDSKAE